MPRAIFVNVTKLYKDLAQPVAYGSAVLRNCTSGWWRINLVKAAGVEYAFGVRKSYVVSAYAVNVPATSWPVMPKATPGRPNPEGRNRLYIPATDLSKNNWVSATRWTIRMYGPICYGDVVVDAQGSFVGGLSLDPPT